VPTLNGRIPKYSLHKASGQAIISLDGKDHYSWGLRNAGKTAEIPDRTSIVFHYSAPFCKSLGAKRTIKQATLLSMRPAPTTGRMVSQKNSAHEMDQWELGGVGFASLISSTRLRHW